MKDSSSSRKHPYVAHREASGSSFVQLAVNQVALDYGSATYRVADNAVVLLASTMNDACVDGFATACHQLHSRLGQFGILFIVEPSAGLHPPLDVHERLTALIGQYTHCIQAAAIVYEQHGFNATLLRSRVTSVNLAVAAKHPNQVFSSLLEAVHWLSKHSNKQRGGSAVDLYSAVTTLRTTFAATRQHLQP